jgi:hypothetical protein
VVVYGEVVGAYAAFEPLSFESFDGADSVSQCASIDPALKLVLEVQLSTRSELEIRVGREQLSHWHQAKDEQSRFRALPHYDAQRDGSLTESPDEYQSIGHG